MKKSLENNKIKVVLTTTSLFILLIAGTSTFYFLESETNIQTNAFAITNTKEQINNTIVKQLENVQISANPVTNNEDGTVTLPMKITNDENTPLTHVDWLIKVQDPEGREVFKSSTLHSHIGNQQITFAPTTSGEYAISLQVASLGPKMMGMDVPAMAQTRILASGDPMMGWQTDPNHFFGVRTTEFKQNVGQEFASKAVQNLQKSQQTTEADQNNKRVVNGSEKDTKVEIAFSTNKDKIFAGESVRLAFDIKNGINGSSITHPDALITVKDGNTTVFQSPPSGDPMMPMNGAFHGHTGQMAFDIVFPSAGVYDISVDANSLPVSNYIFGHANTAFNVEVEPSVSGDPELTQTSISGTPNNSESLVVDIIGQESPFYEPNTLSVKEGSTVIFRNTDAIVHTATSTDDETGTSSPAIGDSFDTGLLMVDEENSVKFDKAGTYNYFCTIHPFMQGTITVTS